MKNRRGASSGTNRAARAARRSGREELRGALRGLYTNLRQGLRAASLRPVDAKAWSVAPQHLIAIAVAAVATGIVLQRTFYGASAQFNWYGLHGQWLSLAVFLLVGWLAARFAARPIPPLTLPIALFAAALSMDLVASAVVHAGMQLGGAAMRAIWQTAYYGWYLWFLAIAAVLLRRTARLAYRHVALAIIPLIALNAYGIAYPPAPLWYQPPVARAAEALERDSPVSEDILYLQPLLVRQALAAVAPQRAGVADLYFVGFAPFARENVFMKETEVIRALMDERFDTRGRSLLLVNNDNALRKYPLATVTNLRVALAHVAQRIDPDEDVVMIYLTSHGDPEHRLSVNYWPLRLTQVDPPLLKQLLDEAGIRWRIVVVSACYSGGYIEPLRGPTTLVMTAADATHTSFGCGAESEFTYFAKALFDEQLRETRSFEQAFARALPGIRARERELGEAFSNPQIAMGEAIRAKLADIERRMESVARANSK